MDRTRISFCSVPSVLAVLALLFLQVQAATTAIQLTYCSSQNTGSDSDAKYWTWQSNGWCSDQCRGNYAFAVVQGNDCWCSDYTPADTTSTSDCNKGCPGFPDEKCGSEDNTLWGYIQLDKQPSGTQGASQPTSTNSQKPSSSAPQTTMKTSTSASSTHTQVTEPTTDVQIVTVSGVAVTKTVVTTPTSGSASLDQTHKSGSSNTGAIVGGVLGGVALLAAIVGGIFFLLWRRRRQQQQEGDDGQTGVQRNTSTMSKSGLLRTEKVPQYPPRIATGGLNRNSRIMQDSDSISPISGSDRRSSRPYLFDQRLNPSAIMNMDNTSRGSFVSMDDSRDYGRTLNVRNPDPE